MEESVRKLAQMMFNFSQLSRYAYISFLLMVVYFYIPYNIVYKLYTKIYMIDYVINVLDSALLIMISAFPY